jgi:hypothetical protein
VKNVVESGGPHVIIWCTLVAIWIPKATDTHSGYVVLSACLQQQRLNAHASMLQVHCFSDLIISFPPYSDTFYAVTMVVTLRYTSPCGSVLTVCTGKDDFV